MKKRTRTISGKRPAAKPEVFRCDYVCGQCDIGAHERCVDKVACNCTHPNWGQRTGVSGRRLRE